MENEERNQATKESTLDRIELFLREMIEALEPSDEPTRGPGRPAVLPALCLWAGVVVCVLRGWNSQLGIWRLLSAKGLWDYPRFAIGDQAIYDRLERAGADALQGLFVQVSRVLEVYLQPYAQNLASFASEVVAIDGMALDQVRRYLPSLRQVPAGDDQLMPGKLGGIFDVNFQQWRHFIHLPNYHQNDKSIAYDLLEHIQRGALILMDLGFFSFEWFDYLTENGYWWISRLREKTTYEVIHTFYQSGETLDALVWLGTYRADRARYAVRLVTFQVGETTYRYITNVLSPKQLSLHDIAVLYARRWDIEMAFKLIKRELGLHLFWSAKPAVLMHQIWAVLLISQILHALQLEIAAKAGVDPFDVSLPLLVKYLPRWHDADFIQFVIERGRDAGFIRPSRRIRIQTPPIDLHDYLPPPHTLILERIPRYAHRRSAPPPLPLSRIPILLDIFHNI